MLPITSQSNNPLNALKFKRLILWVIYGSLGACLALSALSLASSLGNGSGHVLPGFWDIAIWSTAVFLVVARLAYHLELNMVKGYYKMLISVGLLISICIMAVGVVSVILGFVGVIGMVPISGLLVAICVLFANDFFEAHRVTLVLRVIACGFVIGLLIGLTGFLS